MDGEDAALVGGIVDWKIDAKKPAAAGRGMAKVKNTALSTSAAHNVFFALFGQRGLAVEEGNEQMYFISLFSARRSIW